MTTTQQHKPILKRAIIISALITFLVVLGFITDSWTDYGHHAVLLIIGVLTGMGLRELKN